MSGSKRKTKEVPVPVGAVGPYFRTARHFQHASKAETLVADALVGILRALCELADPVEIFLAKRPPAIAD